MNKWKNELKQAFEVPSPVRKRDFLRQLDLRGMSVHEFLFSQIGYIRKRVWFLAAMVLLISILEVKFLPDTVLWFISGLTPFLAMTICLESGRSKFYEMAELEMATRFSLRSVILARLTIIGLMNLIVLGALLTMGLWNNTVNPVAAIIYIITPFLLSSFTGLCIVRKFRGQGAMYACAGTSVGISIFLLLSHNIVSFIYQEGCLTAWIITALVLVFGNGKQCIALIKQAEELSWNLS